MHPRGNPALRRCRDDRSSGQRIDASVSEGVATGERLAATLVDAGITASVKTALAADPALSALKIDVDTRDGVVTLAGPAPDEMARERAAMMAAAPQGARGVENRFVVSSQSALC